MIKVLSFLSNENCFAGHGLSTTPLYQWNEVCFKWSYVMLNPYWIVNVFWFIWKYDLVIVWSEIW